VLRSNQITPTPAKHFYCNVHKIFLGIKLLTAVQGDLNVPECVR